MRIGFFTDTYDPQVSGVSTSINLLKNQLEQLGHQVIIFTTTDPRATETADVVRLPSIPFASFEDRRITYAGFHRALTIASDYRLDLVHSHTEFSLGIIGHAVAHRLRIPLVHTYHTMYENYTHYLLNGALIKPEHVGVLSKWACKATQAIIAPSQMTKTTLRSYGIENPIVVIPTGVTMPTFEPDQAQRVRQSLGILPEERVLLSLSRLSKEKKIDQVIEQFDAVVHHHPDTHLVIVGDGPERRNLEALASQSQAAERIHFVGEVAPNEVHSYYQTADLYINASDSESQGLTYLEAFSNQVPICARDSAYLRELMADRPGLGQLFQTDADFPIVLDTLLTQPKNVAPMDVELLQEISAETFGQRVSELYQTVQNQFHAPVHLGDEREDIYHYLKEMMRSVIPWP